MIARHLVPPSLRSEPWFRWRGGDVSRLEALTDMVFAFALTLLVVSLQVPATFDQLAAAFRQLPAFAACFLLLVMVWYFHYQYHRRYGFEDFPTVILNVALLFVVLFYVYPLKFLFTLLFDQVVGVPDTATLDDGIPAPAVARYQMRSLMILYSAGVVMVFGILALMYLYAWRRRDAIELDAVERAATRGTLRAQLISAGVGVVSIALAAADRPGLAGLIYFVMPVAHGLHGWRSGVALQRLVAERRGSQAG